MPQLHDANGHFLELHHTKWNFISCQKLCGCLSHLFSFHQWQQWPRQHSTSMCNLGWHQTLSSTFLWVFTICLEPQGHCSHIHHLLIITDQQSLSLQTLPGWPYPQQNQRLNSHYNKILYLQMSYFSYIGCFLSSPLGYKVFMNYECSKDVSQLTNPSSLICEFWMIWIHIWIYLVLHNFILYLPNPPMHHFHQLMYRTLLAFKNPGKHWQCWENETFKHLSFLLLCYNPLSCLKKPQCLTANGVNHANAGVHAERTC